jgi:RecB family exonuclease
MNQDFRISYSRINTYLFCPYKYKLIYLDNLHVPLNADITFGHVIHKTLEKFHSKQERSYDKLLELYNNTWKNDGFTNPQQVFEYYMRGKKMLKYYYKSFCLLPSKVVFVEKQFTSNIGKYEFVGIIDRIDECNDNTYEIIDYKTHINIWSQSKVDDDLQLSLYAYACKNIFHFKIKKIAIYFLSKNIKIYTSRTDNVISKAIKLSLDIAENVNIEHFEPNTKKCTSCGLKYKCKYSSK